MCNKEYETIGRGQRDRKVCYTCDEYYVNLIGTNLNIIIGKIASNRSPTKRQKELLTDDLYKIYPKDNRCPILKVNMRFNTRYTPSIDRINNDLGYTIDNVQIISLKANQMKTDATLEEILEFANYYIKT